ncbi:methyltransferase, FkbM family [Methylomagnum ishizawai]|uniref:Methyltransferase, FkbM family n=1 Tax=Methylomagnum ishizawai TaxID=1760988 RepID=A0A1Y6D0F8_9GAMM|nr:hypothetical protein [Methylomagnum ishizawai]SMF96418.1 methyltransferase, FkbM family [Methylomagnum ishizawai]
MNLTALPTPSAALGLLERLPAPPPGLGPCPVDRPLVLYGAGKLGELAADMFAALGIDIAYAVDRAPPPSGLLGGRIPVLTPDQVPSRHKSSVLLAVCVVTAPYRPLHDVLAASGWRRIRPVYDVLEAYADRLPMGNGWFAGPLSAMDRACIVPVLAQWEDDTSRAAHLQILAWRCLRQEWTFDGAPVQLDDRYFIPPMLAALGPQEHCLDAGAWDGTASQQFLRRTGGACQTLTAIEPDPDNARRLRGWVAGLPAELAARVRVLEYALGAEDGACAFAQGHGMASRLMAGAAGTTCVRALDGLDLPCTFAKLHLEGGELAALAGGLDFLRRNRPKLAVTVYHSRDGLWRIPALLMEGLGNYRFYLRLHGWCGTGAVAYAIPRE